MGSLGGLVFVLMYFVVGVWMFVLGLGVGIFDMVLSLVVVVFNFEWWVVVMNWLYLFYCVGVVVMIFVGLLVFKVGLGWCGLCLVLVLLLFGLLVGFVL